MFYSWKLGLVSLIFVPLLIGAMYLQTKIITGHDSVEKKAFENSANVRAQFYEKKNNTFPATNARDIFYYYYFQVAIEAISNIRTVAGLRCEERFSQIYEDELAGNFFFAPHLVV